GRPACPWCSTGTTICAAATARISATCSRTFSPRGGTGRPRCTCPAPRTGAGPGPTPTTWTRRGPGPFWRPSRRWATLTSWWRRSKRIWPRCGCGMIFPGCSPAGEAAAGAAGWCNVTVAQGMEGDGKKEDLTVLLRTSTHRTQKVRSSMEIVQRLRQRYLQFLQVVVDVLTDEVSYRDFEDRLRQELDALGRDIVKWVVESCDERLRE